MGKLRWTVAKRLVFGLLALVLCLSLGASQASAATKSRAKLKVNPVNCDVDIIEDGSGPALLVPEESCIVIIPEILTPVLDDPPERSVELPFVGDESAAPIARLELGSEAWLPIASVDIEDQRQSAQAFSAISATLGGIGAIAAITAFGVDAALFELSHSKSVANWVRQRFGSRFMKIIGRA